MLLISVSSKVEMVDLEVNFLIPELSILEEVTKNYKKLKLSKRIIRTEVRRGLDVLRYVTGLTTKHASSPVEVFLNCI